VAENTDQITELCFDFSADPALIAVRINGEEQRIACGYGRWLRGVAPFGPLDSRTPFVAARPEPWKIAASGAWTDETSYTATLWWHETPYALTLTCRFMDDGRRVTVEQQANVGFGPLRGALLQGTLAVD
jgi:hypothetical protein